MKLLSLTLPTLEQNLALDEALVDQAEADNERSIVGTAEEDAEVLRFWESPQFAAVLGRSSKIAEELDYDYCQQNQVSIGRRCSGGASVVIGPGCLMYGVLLSLEQRPECRQINETHRLVMSKLVDAISQLEIPVEFRGTCDLTLGSKKFSGNSLRCKRNFVFYHGTLLYQFPLEKLQRALRTPPRQPEYRKGRPHDEFVTNLSVEPERLQQAICDAWSVGELRHEWPRERVDQLVEQRYSLEKWTHRH